MNYDLDTEQGLAYSVEWQTKMMSQINDGGTWGIQRSGCIYKV